MRKYIQLAVFVFIFWAISADAKACYVKPYAKGYIAEINAVFGGKKPKLVVEKGMSNEVNAFYVNGVIHIYRDDYKGKCSEETPFLKSVISHEYAHFAEKTLKKITGLKGEKLAYVAEHSIGDEIFNGVVYDNDADEHNLKAYNKIVELIQKKKIKNNMENQSKTVFSKSK